MKSITIVLIALLVLGCVEASLRRHRKVSSKTQYKKIKSTMAKRSHKARHSQLPLDFDSDGNQICLISKVAHYEICKRINECGLCTISPHCGWCVHEEQQRCMPGGKSQSACPNGPDHCSGADWIFDVAQCEGIPRSQTVDNLLAEDETHEAGAFTNVAPEARHFITAEIANKNFAVTVDTDGTQQNQFFVPMNGNTNEIKFHGVRK